MYWLSFWAVLVIAWMSSGRVGRAGIARRWLLIHVVLALGMLPLLLVFFQQASLIAPLANMLAVPLVGLLVVPLALLAVALFIIFEPAGSGLLEISAALIEMFWPALQWLAGLQHAVWTQHQPVAWTLLPAIFGLALLLMPRGIPARPVPSYPSASGRRSARAGRARPPASPRAGRRNPRGRSAGGRGAYPGVIRLSAAPRSATP